MQENQEFKAILSYVVSLRQGLIKPKNKETNKIVRILQVWCGHIKTVTPALRLR